MSGRPNIMDVRVVNVNENGALLNPKDWTEIKGMKNHGFLKSDGVEKDDEIISNLNKEVSKERKKQADENRDLCTCCNYNQFDD